MCLFWVPQLYGRQTWNHWSTPLTHTVFRKCHILYFKRFVSMLDAHFRSWDIVDFQKPEDFHSRHITMLLSVRGLRCWRRGGGDSTCPLSSQQFWAFAAPGCSDCTRWPALVSSANFRRFFSRLICHISKTFLKFSQRDFPKWLLRPEKRCNGSCNSRKPLVQVPK